ncbi:MAG TPA: formylglycine-generating enzyme family protein [Candidatus Acidoferrum sp.]|nr:formylglycine-generating enzyme family protein [Candidatus Acidoferrum sp.]
MHQRIATGRGLSFVLLAIVEFGYACLFGSGVAEEPGWRGFLHSTDRLNLVRRYLVRARAHRELPEGPFIMGTKYDSQNLAEAEESPPHHVWLSAYQIQRAPITVAQWGIFIADTDYDWSYEAWLEAVRGCVIDEAEENYPITNVSWFDCSAFLEWLKRKEGVPYALPTEAQWERTRIGLVRKTKSSSQRLIA